MNNSKKKGTVLIIEDDIDNLELLTIILENSGFDVIAISHPKEVRKHIMPRPDVILMDVVLPYKDGLTLCKEFSSDLLLNEIPIVLISARTSATDIAKGYQCGATDYITKPWHNEDLVERISNCVKGKKVIYARDSFLTQ